MKWKPELQILDTSPFRQMLYSVSTGKTEAEAGLLRAIHLYQNDAPEVALGRVTSGKYIAELSEQGGVSLATYDEDTGLIEKAHVNSSGIYTEYLVDGSRSIDSDMQFSGNNAVIYLAMMQKILSVPEVLDAYAEYVSQDSDDSLEKLIRLIQTAIYEDYQVRLQDPYEHRGMIRKADVDMGRYSNVTEINKGVLRILTQCSKKSDTVAITEDYSLGVILSDSQKAHLKEIPKGHVVSIHEKTILDLVKRTYHTDEPIMNFLLIGPPGTGKSQMAMAISSRLGLPYYPFVCSRNTDEDTLLGCIMPKVLTENEEISQDESLFPDEMEIDLDPSGSLIKAISALKSGKAFTNVQYEYKASPVVEVFKNGGVLEIQEPSALADPSVLTILNDVMNSKDGILITPDGPIRRNPNAIVIYTTNPSTDIGYNEMQKAVKDRVLTLKVELTTDMMRERISSSYPLLDMDVLDTMVDTVELLDREIEKRGINGTCGMRALKDWAHITQLGMSLSDAFSYAVLNRVTTDSDEQKILSDLVAQNSYLLKDVASFSE